MRELDTEVFGISLDSYASDKEFHTQLGLPFRLLSDWFREVTPEYGALNTNQMVANRWSFLIDKEGIIRYTQQSPLNAPRDFQAMLAEVESLSEEEQ